MSDKRRRMGLTGKAKRSSSGTARRGSKARRDVMVWVAQRMKTFLDTEETLEDASTSSSLSSSSSSSSASSSTRTDLSTDLADQTLFPTKHEMALTSAVVPMPREAVQTSGEFGSTGDHQPSSAGEYEKALLSEIDCAPGTEKPLQGGHKEALPTKKRSRIEELVDGGGSIAARLASMKVPAPLKAGGKYDDDEYGEEEEEEEEEESDEPLGDDSEEEDEPLDEDDELSAEVTNVKDTSNTASLPLSTKIASKSLSNTAGAPRKRKGPTQPIPVFLPDGGFYFSDGRGDILEEPYAHLQKPQQHIGGNQGNPQLRVQEHAVAAANFQGGFHHLRQFSLSQHASQQGGGFNKF
jgi:hypothetical protein